LEASRARQHNSGDEREIKLDLPQEKGLTMDITVFFGSKLAALTGQSQLQAAGGHGNV
jgi:hypothetical protein